MNRKIIVGVAVALMGASFAGCQMRPKLIETEDRDAGNSRIECLDLRITKLFGIDDVVLSDTNKFPVSKLEPGVYHTKLKDPFLGCKDMTWFLGGMPGRGAAMTNQLRGVEMTRRFDGPIDEHSLVAEFQRSTDDVCRMLGVESVEVELGSVERALRETRSFPGMGVKSVLRIQLAGGQNISIRATEPYYVFRDGKALLASYAGIEIDFTFNADLYMTPGCKPSRPADKKDVKEIHIGPDCTTALSKAMIDRPKKRVRRSTPEKKQDPAVNDKGSVKPPAKQ